MNKKTHKLDYTHDFGFTLFGITSDQKDYKLIFEINNATGWMLQREDNYKVFNKKSNSESEFSLFVYNDEESYISYKLISNNHENIRLLDELKNLDYLLLVFDESGYEDFSSLQKKLRSIEGIRAVFAIEPSSLKEKDRLVF
jgi:asparagine N-glycosylation enzyme membrane subunit Stt3